MRLVLQIFGIFFLASLLLGGLLIAAVDFKEAAEIERVSRNPFAKMALANAENFADANAWKTAGIFWVVLSISTIAGIVATVLKRPKFGIWVGIALLALTVVVVLLQPALESTQQLNPKTLGMSVAFFGAFGMAILLLLSTQLKAGTNASSGI